MKIIEAVELIFIAIINLFYNAGLILIEAIICGRHLWWWKLRFLLFFNYLFVSTYKLISSESSKSGYEFNNFIYGETPCVTLKKMLDTVKHSPGDKFVDLGSGRGLSVFCAHYMAGLDACGYELIKPFYDRAVNIKNALKSDGVSFFYKDMLESDLSDAKIVYIAGTTFTDEFIKKLEEKLGELKPGAYVITLSYPLKDNRFNVVASQKLYFTWGSSHVYYHIRVDG